MTLYYPLKPSKNAMDNHDNVTWISCNNLAVQDKINFIQLGIVRLFPLSCTKKQPPSD